MKNGDPLIIYIYHSVFGEGFLVFIFYLNLKEMFVIIKYIHKICVISHLHFKKKSNPSFYHSGKYCLLPLAFHNAFHNWNSLWFECCCWSDCVSKQNINEENTLYFCRHYRQLQFRIIQTSIKYSMHLSKIIFIQAVLGALQIGIALNL